MKNLLFTIAICSFYCFAFSSGKPKLNSTLSGTWNYINATKEIDFADSKIFEMAAKEQFVFNENKKFIHNFLDKNNNIIKTLSGTYSINNDEIIIKYKDVDYSFKTSFFFIGNDLVFGSALSHLIFTKDASDANDLANK